PTRLARPVKRRAAAFGLLASAVVSFPTSSAFSFPLVPANDCVVTLSLDVVLDVLPELAEVTVNELSSVKPIDASELNDREPVFDAKLEIMLTMRSLSDRTS